MTKSKLTTIDSLSFQDIHDEAELIPLMTPEDEDAINKEELLRETKEKVKFPS